MAGKVSQWGSGIGNKIEIGKCEGKGKCPTEHCLDILDSCFSLWKGLTASPLDPLLNWITNLIFMIRISFAQRQAFYLKPSCLRFARRWHLSFTLRNSILAEFDSVYKNIASLNQRRFRGRHYSQKESIGSPLFKVAGSVVAWSMREVQ